MGELARGSQREEKRRVYGMCARKRRFETRAAAWANAGATAKRAYLCPYCGGWHLTTQVRRV